MGWVVELVALGLEEELRRRADDLEGRRADEEQVRAGIDPTQRTIEADPVEGRARGDVLGQVERLAARQDDLDGLAARDGLLGDLDGADVLVATQARVDRSRQGLPGRIARAFDGPADLGRARPAGPLQRLEDRGLGDPVAALEVGGLGVERSDRAQGVGQVVEDQHEVGLDEGRGRDADRVAVGQRDVRLEDADRVVRQGADGATGEPRHALGRLDPAARREGADRVERVATVHGLDREVGRVGRDGDRTGLDPGEAVAHLQEAARTGPQERVAAQAFPALDTLEEVGGPAVIEAQERADRGLEIRRPRGAQQDRVGVGGQTLGLRQADRIGCGHRGRPLRIKKRPFVPGTKGRAFRGATLIRRVPHSS